MCGLESSVCQVSSVCGGRALRCAHRRMFGPWLIFCMISRRRRSGIQMTAENAHTISMKIIFGDNNRVSSVIYFYKKKTKLTTGHLTLMEMEIWSASENDG